MLEMLGLILGGGICFLLSMGVHKAIEYGEREGIVQKKETATSVSPRSEAME